MLASFIHIFSIISAAVLDVVFLAGYEVEGYSHWVNLLHLGSFATLFGVNIWVIFIAGMVLIRSIPRHQFGKAQSALFPVFNSFCFALSCWTLTAVFLQYPYHRMETWGNEMLIQIACLATAMILFVFQLLLFVPKNISLTNKLHLLEREAGVGEEISMKAPPNEELQNNAEYKSLKRQFGMWHGMSALVGLVNMILLCCHMYYLAGKVNIQLNAVVQIPVRE